MENAINILFDQLKKDIPGVTGASREIQMAIIGGFIAGIRGTLKTIKNLPVAEQEKDLFTLMEHLDQFEKQQEKNFS